MKRFARQMLKAMGAPWRLTAWEIQCAKQRKHSSQITARYLAQPGLKKLHLGCGRNLMKDWLNTDIYTTQGPEVVFLDVTKPFPLPDSTFDYVFSEHMIEHLPHADGATMLRESCRVLKPGGRIRIATPNLKNILALYGENLSPVQQEYIRWSMDRHEPGSKQYTPARVINTFMSSWGHRFIYDVGSLSDAFKAAGFGEVSEHRPQQSEDANLRDIELHAQEIGSVAMNDFETMVLEAVKPGG